MSVGRGFRRSEASLEALLYAPVHAPSTARGPMPSIRTRQFLRWIPQLPAVAILGLASTTKLLGAADAVALFTLLGAEPAGRLAVGALELVATVLLLWPRHSLLGASLGAFVVLGAIATHILRIGITYGGDASLFIMAWVVLLSCLTTIWLRRPTGA